MKLKLEQNDPVTILTVSEDISAENLPVLKAGLTKLFQSGKEAILLDMTALAFADLKPSSLAVDLAALPTWANETGFDLVIASKIAEVSQTPDRATGLALFTSPIADLLIEEMTLKNTLRDLTGKKKTLENRLNALKADEAKVRTLQGEKSRHLSLIQLLVRQIRKLARQRTASHFGKPEATANRTKLVKTLTPILMEQKVLFEKKAGT